MVFLPTPKIISVNEEVISGRGMSLRTDPLASGVNTGNKRHSRHRLTPREIMLKNIHW